MVLLNALPPCIIVAEEVRVPQFSLFGRYGSRKVFDRLNQEDDFFSDYRPCKISEKLTLADAIVIARNRVRAHFDPVAIKLDPSCRAMGGHIHIAKVTREEGLRWVPGFEPQPHGGCDQI
jgi:hypothetical protein